MKKNGWRSLRIKIIAWSFVPTAIILSAVAWFTFYSYQRVLGDLAIKQSPEMVRPKAEAVSNAIGGLLRDPLVSILLDVDSNHELPLADRALNILENARGLEIFDGGIYFLDRQGRVFLTRPPQPELIGQDWSDTPHFRSINETPNMSATTDLIAIGSAGRKIFCSATALGGQTWTEVVGALYSCFAVYPPTQNAYYGAISKLDLGSNMYVVDRNLQIVFSPNLSDMGKDLSGQAFLQKLSQGENKSGRFQIGTRDMVVSYVPVVPPSDRASWYLVAETSWDEVMQPSLPYRQLLLVLLALGVIVPVLVTAYGVRHITDPIQKLIHAAEQVTAGKFRHRIEVNTGDEIETLAEQFNLMSAELGDSYASLEKKVAERTHEMAALNAIAARVSSSLNLNEIMADALERMMELAGMEHGVAYRIVGGEEGAAGGEEAHLRVMAVRGFPPSFADLGDKLPLRQSAAGVAGRTGGPMIWTLAELPSESTLKKRLATQGVEQIIAIPLMAKGRLVGSLNLSTNQSRIYPPEQIALLKTIGQQVGVAVENARLYEQAERSAQAAERSRLARELHDSVTQSLYSMTLYAEATARLLTRGRQEEAIVRLRELRDTAQEALRAMRLLIFELHPPALEKGLALALQARLDTVESRCGVRVDLQIEGKEELSSDLQAELYHIALEALNNALKHARAQSVHVHLAQSQALVHLQIRDDGAGFETAPASKRGGYGISGMRERARRIGGTLEITSAPGQGTCVTVDVPTSTREGENGAHD